MSTRNKNCTVSLLHNALVDVEMTDNEIMSIIDSNPDAVQCPNKDGDYPLHIACRGRHNQSYSSFRSTTSTAVNSILTTDTSCTGSNSIIAREEEEMDDDITLSPVIVKKLISLNRRAVMKRSSHDGQHPIKFLFQRKHIINTQ